MSKITTQTALLVSARAYLSDERRWNRDGAYFELDKGNNVVKACMIGAVDYIAMLHKSDTFPNVYRLALDAEGTLHLAFRELAGTAGASLTMTTWQDRSATHAEMLAVFDKAVEISREAA